MSHRNLYPPTSCSRCGSMAIVLRGRPLVHTELTLLLRCQECKYQFQSVWYWPESVDAITPPAAPRCSRFNGAVYDPAKDDARLSRQLGRVYACMIDGRWRTLPEIAAVTHDPPASISAQLRHLRKERFGSYIVDKRLRPPSEGLYEYHISPPRGDA